MDFGFTEEQDDVRDLARRILEDKVTEERLREVEAGPDRFDPDTWQALATAGLLGIGLPEDVGGGGFGIIEQCLVLEQVGRTVAPVPVLPSIVMGAMPVAAFGTPAQRSEWVPPAASGVAILTAALVEPLNVDPLRPSTTATRDGSGWRLSGMKTCVPAGMQASLFLVPATVSGGGAVEVFLVPAQADGLSVERQAVTNRESEAQLTLDGVAVGSDDVLGAGALEWMLQRATVGLCAMQLGVVSKAMEMTAEYTKTRVQFERPIATFQAVGQRMADVYIDVEGVRLTLWQAAWRLAEGVPAAAEVEVAKFWASDAGHRVAHAVVHLHGGVGVDVDYPLHRYFLAAKKIELTLGSATEQLLRLGRELSVPA